MSISSPIPPQPPRAPPAPSMESILCYRTVSGAQLGGQAAAIARVLYAVGRTSSEETLFLVTPDLRRISYADSGTMFRPRQSGLPTSANDAEGLARQCVQEVNSALGKAGVLAAMKATAFLPEELKLLNSTPVYDPDTLEIDHWRIRFLPLVRSSASVPEAEVSDGAVEMRIGEEGRMLGLVAQWRPITQTMMCCPLPPPDPRDLSWTDQASQRAGRGAEGGTESGALLLIYALGESANGDSQLLPYYVFEADPLRRGYPAARDSGKPSAGLGG
jgi:hypothetical protein